MYSKPAAKVGCSLIGYIRIYQTRDMEPNGLMSAAEWNILVIEDPANNVDMISKALRLFGIRCVCVLTLKEALRGIDDDDFTHIIVDLSFHGLNNWLTLKNFAKHKRLTDIPCIAISAFHEPGLAEEAIRAGFRAYFIKPVDDIVLLCALQIIMEF